MHDPNYILEVTSLAFSSGGQFLFSGGEEGVLVMWHTQSHEKTFLPRLGASIASIESSASSPSANSSESRVIVTTMDNSVRVVNLASMKEEWCLRSASLPTKNMAVLQGPISMKGIFLLNFVVFEF